MAGILDITILGAEKLGNAMHNAKNITEQELIKAMTKSAIETEKLARSKAPHKKGGLWNSIHSTPAVATSNNVEARVGTNLKYARAQEAGTVGMTIHSHSKLGTVFSYIGNIKPKWYMRDAKIEARPLVTNNISEAMRRIVSKLAGV